MSIVPVTNDNNPLAALQEGIVGTVSNEVPIESGFIPRLQLLAALSKIRKEWDKEKGPKPEEGTFCAGPPGFIYLGNKFKMVPLAWRDHALRTQADEVMLESFNAPALGSLPKTPEEQVFNDIKLAAAAKSEEDKKKNVQNRVGKDVLCWIPMQTIKDNPYSAMVKGIYAVYYLAGTALPEADNFKLHFFKKIVVRPRLINNPKTGFSWHVPEVDRDGDGILEPEDLPDMNVTKEEMTKFANPTAKGKDLPKPEAAAGVDGRAR